MRLPSVLSSCLFLSAALLTSAETDAQTTEKATESLANRLEEETTETSYRAEEKMKVAIGRYHCFAKLADQYQQDKKEICGDTPITDPTPKEIIARRNAEQCGPAYAWERGVRATCHYTIAAPLNWAGRTIRQGGKGLIQTADNLPWGVRHVTAVTGSLLKNGGGFMRTLNTTLVENLPTTIIGRFPTDPIESTIDVPFQAMETTMNTLRYTADTVHTTIRESVNLFADPFKAAGEWTNESHLIQTSNTTAATADGLMITATHLPILLGDSFVFIQKYLTMKAGINTPWRKSGDLRVGLLEGDAAPHSAQIRQAWQSLLREKMNALPPQPTKPTTEVTQPKSVATHALPLLPTKQTPQHTKE